MFTVLPCCEVQYSDNPAVAADLRAQDDPVPGGGGELLGYFKVKLDHTGTIA